MMRRKQGYGPNASSSLCLPKNLLLFNCLCTHVRLACGFREYNGVNTPLVCFWLWGTIRHVWPLLIFANQMVKPESLFITKAPFTLPVRRF